MVTDAKMKVDQHEKELCFAKQAEDHNSIHTLGSETRQLMIQMLAKKVKNNIWPWKRYTLIAKKEKLEQENVLLAKSTATPQKSNRSPSSA